MILYRPVKWVRNVDWKFTQWFGVNSEYYKTIWRPWWHQWLDYAPRPIWSIKSVYSSCSGQVIKIWNEPTGFWLYVVVQCWDCLIYYAHLASIVVKMWQRVSSHDEIGVIGNSGNSTWPHLHFWVKKMWEWIDPTSFIKDWSYEKKKSKDQLIIDKYIRDWVWNWIPSDWVTERLVILIDKAIDKYKK